MNLTDPAERSANAGEYVLGTLSAEERREFEAACAKDPALRREQYQWEQRLAGLSANLPPVGPRAVVWLNVLHQTMTAQKGSVAPSTAAGRPTRTWAALATAASLILAFGWYREVSKPPVEPVIERVEVPVAASSYVALLQVPQSTMRWSISAVPEKNEIVVRAEGDVPAAAKDLDAELWLIADGGPVSLGVIPKTGEVRRAMPAGMAFASGRTVAVSLEPIGGSKTGAPTGPVVTSATVMQAG
jgi:anti-sigma-K factor RskA